MPSNVLPLHLKQTFPPIIWICTEGEGDGIESRLPFKIFSTLTQFKNHIVISLWLSKLTQSQNNKNEFLYFLSKHQIILC